VRRDGTEVRVLYVVEPVRAYLSAAMIPHFVPHVAAIEEDRKKEAQELVRGAAEELSKAGFQASGLVEEGDAKARIIDHAAEWQADLIVVGSYGFTGLNRFLMGSVSDVVVRHAGCSVEVVRIPVDSEPSGRLTDRLLKRGLFAGVLDANWKGRPRRNPPRPSSPNRRIGRNTARLARRGGSWSEA
jgi:nucleotide-binding universal stress UspA family protein